jgi:multidrug efflux pump subunit AcrA (membrane-fusion protein)
LTVTGSVVARIRPGTESLEFRWQFASADVASTYADWLKTSVDMEFAKKQLDATRELTQAQAKRYEGIVDRLRPLAPGGDIPVKDYMEAEANLVQAKLQGQKEVFQAESNFRSAQRQHNALERDLSQAGIEPAALSRAREGMVLVSANVPEAKIALVSRGQSCVVKFFGLPGAVFSAHVEELGSVLSTERRTLRVLFDLEDKDDRLRPGMFAEIGLGTDPREAILIPTTAVIHLNRDDYVFRHAAGDEPYYDVVKVEVSEAPGDTVEVISGLSPGDRIAGNDAVLFKPLAIRSLAD